MSDWPRELIEAVRNAYDPARMTPFNAGELARGGKRARRKSKTQALAVGEVPE